MFSSGEDVGSDSDRPSTRGAPPTGTNQNTTAEQPPMGRLMAIRWNGKDPCWSLKETSRSFPVDAKEDLKDSIFVAIVSPAHIRSTHVTCPN